MKCVYFFFLYMLIKNYPTCPTILPHADKPRQDAIYSKKFGRIIFPLSYHFSFRCILPSQRMASGRHLWDWAFGRIVILPFILPTQKYRSDATFKANFGRIIILLFILPFSRKIILPFLGDSFSRCVKDWARKNRRSFFTTPAVTLIAEVTDLIANLCLRSRFVTVRLDF